MYNCHKKNAQNLNATFLKYKMYYLFSIMNI